MMISAERGHPEPTSVSAHADALAQATDAIASVILGKRPQVRLALACLLARGHLLLEDLPGMGKTTLAHALAQTLGLDYRRVQFTSDLLPADVVGASVYDRASSRFEFHPGPVFTQVLLADEVNRATPKTQSALLEAMAEQQVSSDGETRPLPAPFFVIATQNPVDQLGTYALPESQLDRFLLRLSLGHPDRGAERALLEGDDRRQLLVDLEPVLDPARLTRLQHAASQIRAAPKLLDYLQDLLAATRRANAFRTGLSPRAGLGLLAAARAWALLEGRDYLLPEDVQQVFPAVAGHRLQPRATEESAAPGDVHELLASVAVGV